MNKFLKFLNIAVIPITITIISCFYSEFKRLDFILASIIFLVCGMAGYIFYLNEQLQENECKLNEEIVNRDSEIQSLNNKVSQMAIYSNGNNPYILQMYLKNNFAQEIKKSQFYSVELIVSTINKKYDIKYLNISFDKKTKAYIEQERNSFRDSEYILSNSVPSIRNNKKEYNFKIKDDFENKLTAKCKLKLKFENIGIQKIVIEVVGENNLIHRVDEMEFNVVH
ncbi:MAG: hypothetical protein ACLSBN_15020 [Clostridium perfringens]|uniref:hypothetical protein n=1 Tax=Clostridium perfringens TaxID=1502 RepID=UPI002365212B|nr:hypothetical protein [Clostridium perfringens]